MDYNTISQVLIALLGVTAIWLSQDSRETVRKWACVFGLLSQPFWFYSSYVSEQWGIFILCFFYATAWLKGFYNNWIKQQ